MSALSIQPTYPIFTDIDGQPLEDGFVWIGQANLDPQVNPINVFWDAALTIPAGQPIRTLGGYPSNSGTPARLYVNSDYSIRVMNKNGSVVYSAPAATERYNGSVISTINASQVVYDPAGSGAVPTTAQAKLRETVSVKDFGAVGDGVTDDTAAIQAAHNTGKPVFYMDGETYLISSSIAFGADGLVAHGNGATIRMAVGLVTAYQANANASRFEMRGLNFIADGEALDTPIYKNAVSFYENTGTVSSFPVGIPYSAASVLIEDCAFSCTRVFLHTVDDICTVSRNVFSTALARIVPCHLYVNETEQCNISENVFYAAYYDGSGNIDCLKITGLSKNVNVTNNKFTHRYTDSNAQVDVFTGLYAAQFVGNQLYNVEYHRKQTGVIGAYDVSYDKMLGNHFEYTLTTSREARCIYYRGARSIISSNTFKVRKTAGLTQTVFAIDLDDEDANYPPFTTDTAQSVLINGNIFDFLSSGGSCTGIQVQPGSGTAPSFISIIGNHQLGGQRLVSGQPVGTLIGNTWRDPDTPTGVVSASAASSNVFPSASQIQSTVNNRATQSWLNVAADLPSVAVNSFLRVSAAITLTDLVDGLAGQIVYIDIRVNSTVVHNNAKIVLNGFVDFVASSRSSLTLIKTQDGYWLEIGRCAA